jgi:hypothetical protein
MYTRRELLKILGVLPGLPLLKGLAVMASWPVKPASGNPQAMIYRSINGTPAENMRQAVALAGGIESVVGKDDIIIIKPNVQWWNQGAPNMGALYAFIKMIIDRSGGFSGEVVVAENCHRGSQPWTSAGWSHTFERNRSISGVKNYNDLTKRLKKDFGDRYSTVHWIDVKYGARRVFSPGEDGGYVFCDGSGGVPKLVFGNGLSGDDWRETVMTYPIFKTDKGTIIDYRNGIWEKGRYDNVRLKFINFAALNHHSTYCGSTSLIKNYLGVADLSGGSDPFDGGKLTDRYNNFHSFAFNKWSPGPQPGMLGAEVSVFLDTIRKPDLNVVTAEWIGLADRIEPPVARTRAVMVSTDPVALDYHSAKYLLYPNSGIRFHDPERPDSPTYQYIKACADHGGGIFDESKVGLVSYDHKVRRLQQDCEAVIIGDKKWGSNSKALGQYLLMRYGAFLL